MDGAALSQTVRYWTDPVHYQHPELLWGIAILAGLGLVLALWMWFEFRRRLRLFAAARMSAAAVGTHVLAFKQIRLVLRILGLMAVCVALARPMGPAEKNTASREGVNLLIALDGSRSMRVDDVAPNRFALAQAGIDSLIDSMHGDRAGLMLFAGQSTLVAPLTFDTVSLKLIVQGLDPELAGKGGSSLSQVIERGTEYLTRKNHPSKILIIFSDGEETEGDAVIAAQNAFQKHGVRVFTMGTGTAQGALIPRYERDTQRKLVRMGNVRDGEGNPVHSQLAEDALRTTALAGGGTYTNLQSVKGNLSAFYQSAIQPLAAPMEAVPLEDLKELFMIPLMVALALLSLEFLWPGSLLPLRTAVAWVVLMFVPSAHAAPDAQEMMNAGDYSQAFKSLQQALLKEPEDPLAQYNYAVGAYAVKKYSVAIETFEKLAESTEPEVQFRSHLQLGNSLFRLGEEMAKDNPEGAIVQWTKALQAYEKAAENPAVAHNAAKVSTDLIGLLKRLAKNKVREGDEAARVAPEKGIPAWREALDFYDRGLKAAVAESDVQSLSKLRGAVAEKIFRAYMDSAQDKARLARLQQNGPIEQAIEQMQSALSDYTEALLVKPGNKQALQAQKEAQDVIEPWLIKYADQLHEEGNEQKAGFLEEAMALWKKAAALYTQVLQNNPDSAEAKRGQARNDQAIFEGYLALGDEKQKAAARGVQSQAEKDALLEQALDHYRAALALKPDSPIAKEKLQTLGIKLADRFVERGREEYRQGEKHVPKPQEAITWLERSVQSFGKALDVVPESGPARKGKTAAEDLLRKLRDLDAENQRRMLNEGKKLASAEEMKDAGKMALKLLDYETDKSASKKQQNITLPQDKAVKDW